jgi:hypothetical protein
MKNRIIMLLGATAYLLAACGGGSSAPANSPPPPTVPPPPPATLQPGGLWFGTLTNDMNMVTELFLAFTTDDGRFRLVSGQSDVQFHGQANVTGANFDGDGRAYADAGVNWLDGNPVVDFGLSAVIQQRDSFLGSWVNDSGESGTFEFFYEDLYERDSDTSLLEAVWTGFDELGNPSVTFTIDATGAFVGQNANGCVSSGQISAINPAFNMYEVTSEITNCGIAGTYAGLAVLADDSATNDLLAISIDDGTRAIVFELLK